MLKITQLQKPRTAGEHVNTWTHRTLTIANYDCLP